MTEQQIANLRNVMFTMFGSVALILPDAEVIAFRDEVQRRFDALPESAKLPTMTETPESVRGEPK